MNTPSSLLPDSSRSPAPSRRRRHPLMATAAGAIIVASLMAAQAPVAQADTDTQQNPPPQAQKSSCASCGTVTSIEQIKVEGHGSGVGAVGGAAVGGLVGNQFGHGSGRAAMTVLGAVGGAVAGNAVEKKVRTTTQYRVYVHTEDGHTRYFTYEKQPPFRDGDHVRIKNDKLVSG